MNIFLNIFFLYVFYISAIALQENLYDYRGQNDKYGDRFESASLLMFSKSTMNIVVSEVLMRLKGTERTFISGTSSRVTAIFRSFGTLFGLFSISFISYPYVILGRSVKIIPIFISDLCFSENGVKISGFFSVLITTLGMCLFSSEVIHNDDEQTNSNLIGMILIFMSLSSDCVMSTFQGKVISDRPDPLEMLCYLNKWQLYLSVILNFFTFYQDGGILFCINNPFTILMMITSVSVETIGQIFLFNIIVDKGTLFTAFVTTLRKFITLLFSIVFFSHFISKTQWVAIVILFFGIFLELYMKTGKNNEVEKEIELKEYTEVSQDELSPI